MRMERKISSQINTNVSYSHRCKSKLQFTVQNKDFITVDVDYPQVPYLLVLLAIHIQATASPFWNLAEYMKLDALGTLSQTRAAVN